MRKCKVCGQTKPLDEFQANSGYRLHTCRECFGRKNRERTAEYTAANRKTINERQRARYARNREEVFTHYGDKCACCGESEPLFLAIDHVDNDGRFHRKNNGGSSHNNIYGWLVQMDFPDGFQVLCMNCNHGKHRNGGVCPHKRQEGSTIIP